MRSMGECPTNPMSLSSRNFWEVLHRCRINPFVWIHRGPLDGPWLQVTNLSFHISVLVHLIFLDSLKTKFTTYSSGTLFPFPFILSLHLYLLCSAMRDLYNWYVSLISLHDFWNIRWKTHTELFLFLPVFLYFFLLASALEPWLLRYEKHSQKSRQKFILSHHNYLTVLDF